MDRYASARAYLQAHQPDMPIFGLRPHAAGRAARWFGTLKYLVLFGATGTTAIMITLAFFPATCWQKSIHFCDRCWTR